jgi:hypothetical protein
MFTAISIPQDVQDEHKREVRIVDQSATAIMADPVTNPDGSKTFPRGPDLVKVLSRSPQLATTIETARVAIAAKDQNEIAAATEAHALIQWVLDHPIEKGKMLKIPDEDKGKYAKLEAVLKRAGLTLESLNRPSSTALASVTNGGAMQSGKSKNPPPAGTTSTGSKT